MEEYRRCITSVGGCYGMRHVLLAYLVFTLHMSLDAKEEPSNQNQGRCKNTAASLCTVASSIFMKGPPYYPRSALHLVSILSNLSSAGVMLHLLLRPRQTAQLPRVSVILILHPNRPLSSHHYLHIPAQRSLSIFLPLGPSLVLPATQNPSEKHHKAGHN